MVGFEGSARSKLSALKKITLKKNVSKKLQKTEFYHACHSAPQAQILVFRKLKDSLLQVTSLCSAKPVTVQRCLWARVCICYTRRGQTT